MLLPLAVLQTQVVTYIFTYVYVCSDLLSWLNWERKFLYFGFQTMQTYVFTYQFNIHYSFSILQALGMKVVKKTDRPEQKVY